MIVHKSVGMKRNHNSSCLLYTSDAADEEDSVDLGGRRIIKKKKNGELLEKNRSKNRSKNNKKR